MQNPAHIQFGDNRLKSEIDFNNFRFGKGLEESRAPISGDRSQFGTKMEKDLMRDNKGVFGHTFQKFKSIFK